MVKDLQAAAEAAHGRAGQGPDEEVHAVKPKGRGPSPRPRAHGGVLAEHIQRVVAEAPPLTDEQRDRLAGLLRGGGQA